jgi:hypothetical protein
MKGQQSKVILYLNGAADKWTYSDADLPEWVASFTPITTASTMGKRKHSSRESTGGVERLLEYWDSFECRLA